MPLRFLVDENIPGNVIVSLRKSGHDVKAVSKGSSDPHIASTSIKEDRVILTFDSDFANILAYPPDIYPGIIFLRIEPPSIELILKSLDHIINHFPANADFKGRLIVGEPQRFRVWG